MQTQVTKLNFEGENIYVGIDTHKKNWKVAIYHDEIALKTFVQDPVPIVLAKYLKKNYPGANYKCAYEAGFCGFWIQKSLSKHGINCIIVNPADVPTTNKEKEFKTDARDCRKIAKSLRSNQLEAIYIPSDQGLESRSIMRYYRDKVKDQTRYKNKIKGMIAFYGIQYPSQFQLSSTHWSKKFYSWLKELKLTDDFGTWVMQSYVQQSLNAEEKVKQANNKVRELANNEIHSKDFALLQTIPGVGLFTAMTILTEIETITRFKNLDALCSYFGLVPSTKSSGENDKVGKMTNRGNKHLKTTLIESAWMAIRHDPALTIKFIQLKKRMDANKAIVRIAKKLIARIYYVLRTGNKYQIRLVNN